MRLTTVLFAACLAAAPLHAQAPAALPDGWRLRYDRPTAGDSALKMVIMRPGWHLTTTGAGSAALWRTAPEATGVFTVEVESFLFPGTGHAEGFGVIFGGRGLDGAAQRYWYFLINADGRFMVSRRDAASVQRVVPWTAAAAVARPTASDDARNVLTVRAGADSLVFSVNGTRVHAMARPADVDGLVGLRVNHNLSVHVSRVDVGR